MQGADPTSLLSLVVVLCLHTTLHTAYFLFIPLCDCAGCPSCTWCRWARRMVAARSLTLRWMKTPMLPWQSTPQACQSQSHFVRCSAPSRPALPRSASHKLTSRQQPTPTSLLQIGGRSVVDARVTEELCATSRVMVSVNRASKVCAVQTSGKGSISPAALHASIEVSKDARGAIYNCIVGAHDWIALVCGCVHAPVWLPHCWHVDWSGGWCYRS